MTTQFVSAREINHGESQPGLNLFMSTAEQLNLEKEQRDIESDLKEAVEAHVTAIDDEISPADVSTEKLTAQKTMTEETIAEETTAEKTLLPRRYDGVIFKGDQVLNVWFDGSRHFKTPSSPGFEIEFIDQSGRIGFSTDGVSYELIPGDVLFQHQQAPADQSSAATDAFAGDISK